MSMYCQHTSCLKFIRSAII